VAYQNDLRTYAVRWTLKTKHPFFQGMTKTLSVAAAKVNAVTAVSIAASVSQYTGVEHAKSPDAMLC